MGPSRFKGSAANTILFHLFNSFEFGAYFGWLRLYCPQFEKLQDISNLKMEQIHRCSNCMCHVNVYVPTLKTSRTMWGPFCLFLNVWKLMKIIFELGECPRWVRIWWDLWWIDALMLIAIQVFTVTEMNSRKVGLISNYLTTRNSCPECAVPPSAAPFYRTQVSLVRSLGPDVRHSLRDVLQT